MSFPSNILHCCQINWPDLPKICGQTKGTMLIPIGHEGTTARRWPIITFALIALNVICFLPSYSTMQDELQKMMPIKAHILLMAATHPELTLAPEAQQLVDDF